MNDRCFEDYRISKPVQLRFRAPYNFVSDTISSTRLNEYFGFTQKDVEKILEDANITYQAQNIKKWYDGYSTAAGTYDSIFTYTKAYQITIFNFR